MMSSLFQDKYVHYCSSCYIHFPYECPWNPALRATLLQALWHFLSVLSQSLFYITTASLSTVYLCFCYYKCHIAHNQTQERQRETWQWPPARSAICLEIWAALHFCFTKHLIYEQNNSSFFRVVFTDVNGNLVASAHVFLLPFFLQCSKDAIDWILISVLFREPISPFWKLEVSAYGVIVFSRSVRVCEAFCKLCPFVLGQHYTK